MGLACMLSIASVGIFCTHLYGVQQNLTDSARSRTDLIKIDGMSAFGPLEKSPVEFLHDAHTKALSGKNKDCSVCHLKDNEGMSVKFLRIKDTDRIEVMNVYHKGCISCHGEMKLANEKAGPTECDECHRDKSEYSSAQQPMGFDKSLHFRHVEAQQKKCERCHHEYDEKQKKLFYAKGKEGTCRYCHLPETRDNVISMRLASHTACVNCHSKNISQNLSSGPVTCAGCHDRAAQAKIKKISPVPRMDRNQPDMVLIKTQAKAAAADVNQEPNRMKFVPFDHKLHEQYNETCRVCHHESLQPCNECHTLAGKKEGEGVNLENAMHRVDASESCMGCHEIRQASQDCAGCHAPMGRTRVKEDDSCQSCHMMPVPETKQGMSPDQEKLLASAMLKNRKPVSGTYPENDIPEKVTVGHLSKEYEPVEFPHRKIVHALAERIKDDKLAGYFHSGEGTLCKGCHHHSPAAKKPPQCRSCHGQSFDETNPLKPGIMGAYHQQCMGCHQEMGIKKPAGCTECHQKKTNQL